MTDHRRATTRATGVPVPLCCAWFSLSLDFRGVLAMCLYGQRRVAHKICVACTNQKMALARYVVCRWCEQVRRWALARRRSFVSAPVWLSDSMKSPRQNGRGLAVQ